MDFQDEGLTEQLTSPGSHQKILFILLIHV